ncbi:ElaB/YqjD/DUF883 family membrane-anchored ribosome-binding protein [Kibdelosporangium banguiense]|uniref:ElaB/YqjD/DUF883 family membrane-anchored ribosome-binding protein n=1 Tax=Kibdelosporangium banguiense TaxID=1365924 RepID=A0ABS4TUT2_9PSEU|nr:hypothetical protein [Kibdelosporangium banguiense]MBP2328142.1 ElaB/YqjD/DUF883 family membrane-anchored ribosome-binding protein [Kibdelosporangium banguiense]
MYKRALVCAVCTAALFSSITPMAAFAATEYSAVIAAAPTQAERDRADVLTYARYHPYSTVKTDAWLALSSSAPDLACADFLRGGGLEYAIERAARRDEQNKDFIKRVYETNTPQYSPEVHAAAKHLLRAGATASEREQFVRTGYEAAKARDRQFRDAIGEQKRALVEADRNYVRMLAQHDPGEQVRAIAAYATRPGATDDDLVDFFAWGWASGARLDNDAHRLRVLQNNRQWSNTIVRLIADAEAAEKAARDASDEMAEEAKARAMAAWREVGTQTAPARTGWDEARDFAARQAENWHAILLAAQQANTPNWDAVVDPARTSQAAWIEDQNAAAEQAAYWTALLQQAIEREQRVRESR